MCGAVWGTQTSDFACEVCLVSDSERGALAAVQTRSLNRGYSELLTRHEICQLLDEDMTDIERQELEEAEEVCRRFLACDLTAAGEQGSVRDALAEILGCPGRE